MSEAIVEAEPAEYNSRPRMVYGELAISFNAAGDLVIEQMIPDSPSVAVPDNQIDVLLAYIKQHRLSPFEVGAAAAFARPRTSILER